MSINEREKLVLNAIINYYLTFGDTIGSRTLVKKYGIELSSATIRNVMADLEDMGFIGKTHTSSGRIPTDKGYRYYLNELLKVERLSQQEREDIEGFYENRIGELDKLLETTSSLLSRLTNYAGIAVEPRMVDSNIHRIELIHIDEYFIMVVVIMEDRRVKTKKLSLINPIAREELVEIAAELNLRIKKQHLSMKDIEEFILGENVVQASENSMEDMHRFFIDNVTSMLKEKDIDAASEVLDLFSEKKDIRQMFENLIENKGDFSTDVQVLFGDELGIKELEDYSFVYSLYQLGGAQGIIGVIGPKRMAYSKTVGLLDYVTKEVNRVIHRIEKKEVKK